jgi:Tfp pilus assembly protein PilF
MKRIISGLIVGGSFVGATVILLSGPFHQTYQTEAIAAAPVQPTWAQKFPKVEPKIEAKAEKIDPIVELEHQEEVQAERPVVAIANDEKDLDHQAEARRMMEEGDLRGAYGELRKHLYLEAPTRDVLIQVGRIGRELGELALAEQALLDAVALDPTGADIQTELARTLLDAGEHERARIAARQAIRLDNADPLAWNVAGRVALAQSEFDRADSAFRKALELDPMNPVIHNNMGLLHLYMKEGSQAVSSLETAVELYDDAAPAFVFNNLGLAHELAGNFEEAREAFEEALLVSPFYARAKVNLRRIETTIAQISENKAFQTAQGIKASELEPDGNEAPEIGDDG